LPVGAADNSEHLRLCGTVDYETTIYRYCRSFPRAAASNEAARGGAIATTRLRIKPVLGCEDADRLVGPLQCRQGGAGVLPRPATAVEWRTRDLPRYGRRISSTLRVPCPSPPLCTSLVEGLPSVDE
jgi:hypothetical protein